MSSTETTAPPDEPGILELAAIAPPRMRATFTITAADARKHGLKANPTGMRKDGSYYELLNPEDMSLLELQQLGRDFQTVRDAGDATGKAAAEREQLLNTMVVRLIAGLTVKEAATMMTPLMKQSVILRFFAGLNARQLGALDAETLTAIQRG